MNSMTFHFCFHFFQGSEAAYIYGCVVLCFIPLLATLLGKMCPTFFKIGFKTGPLEWF